jgi:hypothetical protein
MGEWLQSSRWDGAIFLMTPGTSCLATIELSLRDKTHPPIEEPRIILAVRLKPWVCKPLRGDFFSEWLKRANSYKKRPLERIAIQEGFFGSFALRPKGLYDSGPLGAKSLATSTPQITEKSS